MYVNDDIEELKDILQELSKENNLWGSKTISEALNKGWEPSPFEEIKESNWYWEVYQELEKEYFPLEERTLKDDIRVMKANYAMEAYDFLYIREWPISHWDLRGA